MLFEKLQKENTVGEYQKQFLEKEMVKLDPWIAKIVEMMEGDEVEEVAIDRLSLRSKPFLM